MVVYDSYTVVYGIYAVVNDSYTMVYGSYAVFNDSYTVVYGSYAMGNDSYTVVYGSYAVVYGSYTVVYGSYTVVYGSYLENTLSPLSCSPPVKSIRRSRTGGEEPMPSLPKSIYSPAEAQGRREKPYGLS